MNKQSILAGLSEPFKALLGNPELNFQVYDLFPIPLEIFTPDGMSVFINRAHMELYHIPDASFIVGKYNLRTDPVALEILGQEVIDQIFRGEFTSAYNVPAPGQDHANRGVVEERPFDAAMMDILQMPVWDGGKFLYTISIFLVRNIYGGRADVARAKAYIREHWREKFDLDALVAAVGTLSGRQFRRVFEAAAGCSPRAYYQKVKLGKIQEKLLDDSLTVAEVFAACGADAHGAYLQLFKEKTGLTPTEYRKERLKKQA